MYDAFQVGPLEPDSYARLLQLNQCYEAMPTSSKMVVFDLDLLLRKAFNGLIYQCESLFWGPRRSPVDPYRGRPSLAGNLDGERNSCNPGAFEWGHLSLPGTRHVLLSDGTQGGIITGILSVTDFIRVMLRLHRLVVLSSPSIFYRERSFLETQVTSTLTNEHEDIGKLTIRTYQGDLAHLCLFD